MTRAGCPAHERDASRTVPIAMLPVTLGYVAVQVACAAHVVLVRLVVRARRTAN